MANMNKKLFARQGMTGYEYYLAEDKPDVWGLLTEEFGISYGDAKKLYHLEEFPVTIIEVTEE